MTAYSSHSVTTRQVDGRWVASCSCGESRESTFKPAVEVWRTQHYRETRSS